jgi:glycosyltransferase involved in cell wall biosynthesis
MSLKADLHVHSMHSKRASEWLLRKIGCAESYTDPRDLYALARERGMNLVTITDHNSISGCLEIAHLEGTFVSEEITAYFPEDGCKFHVLAWNVSEKQHEDIARLRENLFDLVQYLNEQQIVHALAHPFYAVNERLTYEHLDRALLLFKNFELNGSRDDYQNQLLREILENLTAEDIEFLSDKYDMKPMNSEPWRKNLTRGSDDHSSVRVAAVYTMVEEASSAETFLQRLQEGKAKVGGPSSNPKAMAQTIYSVAYQFYKSKFNLDRYVSKDILLRFTDRALVPFAGEEKRLMGRLRNLIAQRRCNHLLRSTPVNMKDIIQKEAAEIILEDPAVHEMVETTAGHPWKNERIWFHFVDQISEKILGQFADSALTNLSGANLFDIFQTIGSAASLYAMLSPCFVGYTFFTRDRRFCELYRERFRPKGNSLQRAKLKVAHFTDTFHDVNGVARTLQMETQTALRNGKQLTMITCGCETDMPGVVNFPPIGAFDLPEYPEIKLYYPPFLKMLDYCYKEGFTHIRSATPGPLGLAALAIARILKLPLYGTYHTALPQYADLLTDDAGVAELMWKYTVWYYNQMDVVYVPSEASGEELCRKGVQKEKIQFYPRGIDVNRFHPSKRNGFFKSRYGLSEDEVKLLYVGRVSKEKNMPLLSGAYRSLVALRPQIRLIVVGDGPYTEEMKEALRDLPVTFTGFLAGEDLAQAYASSDIFIFPSTTDTFGNVVLEAQASGLPVIVTDEGGPRENVVPGRTGFIVPAKQKEVLLDTILSLVDDPAQREKMGFQAREYMENRSFEAAFLQLWDSYRLLDPRGRIEGQLEEGVL